MEVPFCLTAQLARCPACWLAGLLACWLACWLVGWLVACMVGWLAGWLLSATTPPPSRACMCEATSFSCASLPMHPLLDDTILTCCSLLRMYDSLRCCPRSLTSYYSAAGLRAGDGVSRSWDLASTDARSLTFRVASRCSACMPMRFLPSPT